MAHKSKSKMTNGHSKPLVNDSTCAKDSAGESKDILKHISQITQVSGPRHLTKFVPVDGPSRAELEQIRQQRKYSQPRNVRNIGLFEADLDGKQDKNELDSSEEFFDENAHRAEIRVLNGGFIEDRWTRRRFADVEQPNFTEWKKDACNTKGNRDVFARNVGMRSIVKQKMEKKVDSAIKEDSSKCSAVNLNQDGENVGANNCRFPFTQDPNDPDLATRQFCGIDNKDDFLVEHVGKIVKVTARQYLTLYMDEAGFEFSKANK